MFPSSPLKLKSERVASGVLEDDQDEENVSRKRRNSEDGGSISPQVPSTTLQTFMDVTQAATAESAPVVIPGDKRKDRRVENAWWRSWWIERKRIESGLHGEHPMFTEMYTADVMGDDTEFDVELEGVPVVHHKIWEKYYGKFLSKVSEEILLDPVVRAAPDGTTDAHMNVPAQVEEVTPRSFEPSAPIPIPQPDTPPIPLDLHSDKKVRGSGIFANIFANPETTVAAPNPALAALMSQPVAASLVQMFSQPATPPTADTIPIPKEFEDMDAVMLRKYFTEFHNSGRYGGDNVSPYLGEDPSVHSSNAFVFANFGSLSSAAFKRSSSLLAVPELQQMQVQQFDNTPVLQEMPAKEQESPSTSTGPVAANAMKQWMFTSLLSAAPDALIDALWGLPIVDAATCNPAAISANTCVRLGCLHIRTDQMHPWSIRWLVLYDNFLFEFCSNEITGRPFAYCALSGGAFVEERPEMSNVRSDRMFCLEDESKSTTPDTPILVLRCMRECHARSPVMKVMIKLEHDTRGTKIISLLRRACRLTVDDLYDMHLGPTTGKENKESISVLGRGRFTEVHKATKKHVVVHRQGCVPSKDGVCDCQDTAPACALKLVNKQSFWKRVQQGKERADTLVREVLTQAVVSLSNRDMDIPIVRLKGIFETLEYFVLELELMQSADLFDRLSTEGVMSEAQAKSVSRQLVEAVALCSRINIAHRDIKLSNVVFPLPNSEATEEAREDFFKVKLADFGMAGFIGADGRLRGRCGTPGYVAPEILKAWQQEGYSPNVDMFSVGVVTYTLLCGYEPFYGTTDKQLIQANKMAHYEFHMPEWAHVSSEAKDFVAKLLVSEGDSRLSHEEALRHPWLASGASEQMAQRCRAAYECIIS